MTDAPQAPSGLPPSAVLFDFDGTLADTFPRVERLLPRLARELGFLDPGEEGVRALRGRNMPSILAHLGIPRWKVPVVLWRARALFQADLETIPLFPGIVELLTDLDKAGIEWGILTSNGIEVVRRTLYGNGAPEPGWLEAGLGLSGKAKRICRMARNWGIPPGEMVLVADESRDVEASLKAHVPMIAVTWGYNTSLVLEAAGAIRLAQDVGELRRMLLGEMDGPSRT